MRNPILGNVFYRLKKIEKFGTGIKRIKNAYSNSKTKPIFKITDDYISIVLPVVSEDLELTSDEEVVYNVLSKTKMSSSEILNSVNFGRSKTIELLSKLVEKGLLYKEGTGRGVKYYKK